MKPAIIVLALSLAAAQPNSDADQLAALNQEADSLMASSDLTKAEPLLNRALTIASRLGIKDETAAEIRLFDLYVQLGKRDGLSWTHIGLPHLLKAIEASKSQPPEYVSQLGARYALAVMQFTARDLKPAVGSLFLNFLKQSVAETESKSGALGKETSRAYEALADFADGSAAQLQALNACELLTQLNPSKVDSSFAPLLCRCADAKLQSNAADAIRFARAARLAAAPDARKWPYEVALSSVIESEAEFSLSHFEKSLAAAEAAVVAARADLDPHHILWKRIFEIRVSIHTKLRQNELAAQVKSEQKNWLNQYEAGKASARIQTPKERVRRTPPLPATAAVNGYGSAFFAGLCLISAEGNVKMLVSYSDLPYGMTAAGTKALESWTFRPYLLDGKPVAGVTTLRTNFTQ